MLPDLPYSVVNGVPLTHFKGVAGANLYLVHTMHEFMAFYELLMKRKKVAVDSETSGFHYYKNDRMVGMSFGWHTENFYLPFRHVDSLTGGKQPGQLDFDVIRPYIKAFFDRKDVVLIGTNFKFDLHFLKADGITFDRTYHDTRLLMQFVDENAPGALKTISSGWRDLMGRWHQGIVDKEANADEKHLSEWRTEETKARKRKYSADLKAQCELRRTELAFQGWKKPEVKKWVIAHDMCDHPFREVSKDDVHYGYIPIVDMVKYAALDTFLSWKVYDYALAVVESDPKMTKVYLTELNVARALFDSEDFGMPMDVPYLQKLQIDYTAEIELLEAEVRLELGDINLKSTQQLANALIAIGCVLTKRSEKAPDNWCLDKKVLADLAKKYPICQKVLSLRKLEKLKSTYIDSALAGRTDKDIIHPGYNQCVSTGRMSSSGLMNFQTFGRDGIIKKAFLAPDEYDYWFFDYSQVEVRLNAHLSQDPILLECYNAGVDVHLKTSCNMFDVPYNEGVAIYNDKEHPRYAELKEYRNVGKVLNFSIVYQVSPSGLSEQIPRPTKYKDQTKQGWIGTCEGFMEKYFQTHRHIKKFIIRGNREVRANAQVSNTFGRVRHLPHVNAVKLTKNKEKYGYLESKAQRQGVNFMVQGEAGDVFKTACARIHKILKGKKSVMISYVHDECGFYIHKTERHLLPLIKHALEDFNYDVPLVADASYSPRSWGDKSEVPHAVMQDVALIEEYVKEADRKFALKAA